MEKEREPRNEAGSKQAGRGGESNPIMRASINRPPTPNREEDPQKELSLREIINVKAVDSPATGDVQSPKKRLVESGEKEKLMELLRERLVECGWRDEMKALCRAYARKKGRNNVTVDDLIHVITPKGRASVPDSVKAELLQRIQSFLMSSSSLR
ncbi:transcription and mRNA export factor ENY2 isoform X1 [Oryza glaberrima]|uniref:Transcription and mRNA export factor ENY2 n=2 Tax=Oryza TaxID=4527 RepID=A0A0E0N6V9_ORYRU|nr:transcription and mRNA export factor ENY2 isoform X1 [Oryza glaberrima]